MYTYTTYGESTAVALSLCGQYLERLQPTPEVQCPKCRVRVHHCLRMYVSLLQGNTYRIPLGESLLHMPFGLS